MARTLFDTNDPGTVKKWARKAMAELNVNSYFVSRMVGTEGSELPIIRRDDLESGPGDEVTIMMTAKLVGPPIRGDDKAEGREKRLNDSSFKIRIDRHRQPVNIGDVMAQKRRIEDLRQLAVTKLGQYWAEYVDEEIFAQLSGQRGTGENIQHLPMGYNGWPMAFVAPDAEHRMFPGAVTAENALAGSDTMSRALIEKVVLRAETMRGGDTGRSLPMTMCRVEGSRYWVMVMHPAQMHDLRVETGDAGWLSLEKARAAAIGSNSPIFKGEAGATAMLNQTILHKHGSITYRDNYGAGANVRGFRALFLGAGAGTMAFGTNDRAINGVRLKLSETAVDLEDETVVKSQTVMGIAKTRFNNRDLAVISVDTAATATALAGMSV